MENPRIAKRLENECEQNKTPGEFFYIQPLPNNRLLWHFTLLGSEDTPYHTGIYHGYIEFPKNYPMSPPDFFFLNENGRFAPTTRICLNISGYHKESWTPAWNIRSMMEAINAFFNVDEGGIGSLRLTANERKEMAKKSRNYTCPECGPVLSIETLIVNHRNAGKPVQPVVEEKPVENKKDKKPAKEVEAIDRKKKAEPQAKEKKKEAKGVKKDEAKAAKRIKKK